MPRASLAARTASIRSRRGSRLRGSTGRPIMPVPSAMRSAKSLSERVRADAREEAAHRRVAPGLVVGEHVAAHEMRDLFDHRVRESQPLHEGLGVAGRVFLMPIEGGRLARPLRLGLGLADVVEEGGQAQDELGRRRVDAGVEVIEHVVDVHSPLRRRRGRRRARARSPPAGPSPRGASVPARAAARAGSSAARRGLSRPRPCGIGRWRAGSRPRWPPRSRSRAATAKRIARRGRSPSSPKALERVADGAQRRRARSSRPPWGSIREPRREVEGHRVDREVAPREVLLDRSGEFDLIGVAPVGV